MLFWGDCFCAVLTVEAVETGEVSNYFDLAKVGTLPTGSARAGFTWWNKLWLERTVADV